MRNYSTIVQQAGIGRTPQLCQDALIEVLQELFEGKTYESPGGGSKAITVYKQDLPIPLDNDVDADTNDAPAPYIVVAMSGGGIANDNSTQNVDFSIVICCYDGALKREGYQDVANIKEDIIQRFCTKPFFGGCFTVLKPITWALQVESSEPYYYGAITMTCTAPAMTQDTELGDLI